MKKILLLLFIVSLFSCSNNVDITAKYMEIVFDSVGDKFIFIEPKQDFTLTFTFERNHILTSDDLKYLRKKIVSDTPLNIRQECDTSMPNGYIITYSFYFDIEAKNYLDVDHVLEKDILVYYSIIGC